MIKQRQYTDVTRAYAHALFNAAKKAGALDRVEFQVRDLAEIHRANPRLGVFMEGPQFSTEAKLEMLAKLFGGGLEPMLFRMLQLMARRERYGELRGVLQLLEELVEEDKGIFPAMVTTARPLDAVSRVRLEKQLEVYTGCNLKIEWSIDADLIGGVVFRFRDLLLDTSLASGLKRLGRQLTQTQIIKTETA